MVAYGICGITADFIGDVTGTGVGGGSAITVIFSGVCLVIAALIMSGIKKIRELEQSSAEITAQKKETTGESVNGTA